MKNHLPSRMTAVSLKTTYTTLAAALCLTVLLAFPATAQQAATEKPADLAALRASTSPAEKKLSFNLLLISREARHAALGALASSMDSSAINADGTVNVQITAYLSPSLMASPVMAGIVRTSGAVAAVDYASDRMDLRLTKSQLLDLAANPNVLSIREAGRTPSLANMSAANHIPSIATR